MNYFLLHIVGWECCVDYTSSVDAVGFVAFCSSMALYLAPSQTFLGIWRAQAVGEFDFLPYVVSFTNCVLWTSYALLDPIGRAPTLVSNAIGAVLELSYVCVYARYADRSKRASCLCAMIVAAIFVSVVDVLGFAVVGRAGFPKIGDDSRGMSFIGLVAALLNIAMYVSPLSVVSTVIETRSVRYMPLGLTLAMLFTSTTWISYSVMVGDLVVFVPNFIGLVLGVLQLTVYSHYLKVETLATISQKQLDATEQKRPLIDASHCGYSCI